MTNLLVRILQFENLHLGQTNIDVMIMRLGHHTLQPAKQSIICAVLSAQSYFISNSIWSFIWIR